MIRFLSGPARWFRERRAGAAAIRTARSAGPRARRSTRATGWGPRTKLGLEVNQNGTVTGTLEAFEAEAA